MEWQVVSTFLNIKSFTMTCSISEKIIIRFLPLIQTMKGNLLEQKVGAVT